MKFQHDDRNCKDPISEHNGDEPCITVLDDTPSNFNPHDPRNRVFKRGPQGNMVEDHGATARMLYGEPSRGRPLGTPGLADRRDNSDPETIGREILAKKNGQAHAAQ